jgi:hypothetical protein
MIDLVYLTIHYSAYAYINLPSLYMFEHKYTKLFARDSKLY